MNEFLLFRISQMAREQHLQAADEYRRAKQARSQLDSPAAASIKRFPLFRLLPGRESVA